MTTPTAEPWSARKLLVLMATGAILVALLATGLTITIVRAATGSSSATDAASSDLSSQHPKGPDGTRGEQYRNALAAEPMLQATPADLESAPPALNQPERLSIAASKGTGEVGIPTGYPHTPQGAIGQLAAITSTVLAGMSLDGAREVHQHWAGAGAPFDRWPLALSIQAFHASAGTTDGDAAITADVTAVGGQVKGADGPDWVLACVQLDVRVVVVNQARFGFGHCERMEWDGQAWRIAAGQPPALAPSTWPGSQRSVDAGWQPLVMEESP